jgi:hypothetical protein
MQFRFFRLAALALALPGGALLPSLAHAQFAGSEVLGGSPQAQQPTAKLPPALPGAAARRGTPAPAQQVPSDMSPNDALFDAINRGDVATARDALSRGAQLDAHNVLGMTPMELAVDLGRNDIAFLLLSMRNGGEQPSKAAAAPAPAGPAPAPAKPPVRKAAQARPAPVAPPAPPQQARLFAHDGGTPVPSLGFLGFDPERRTP